MQTFENFNPSSFNDPEKLPQSEEERNEFNVISIQKKVNSMKKQNQVALSKFDNRSYKPVYQIQRLKNKVKSVKK